MDPRCLRAIRKEGGVGGDGGGGHEAAHAAAARFAVDLWLQAVLHAVYTEQRRWGQRRSDPCPTRLPSSCTTPPLSTLSSTPPQAIDDASGFTRVLEAARRSNRPVVGHNCWFDVGYVLTACVEPTLPGTWGEYKRLVAEV